MAVSQDPVYAVLAYLQAAEDEVTAQEVRKATGLPLPVVTKVLQTRAGELVPDVERKDLGDRVVYRYIGAGLETLKRPDPKAKSGRRGRSKKSVDAQSENAQESSSTRTEAAESKAVADQPPTEPEHPPVTEPSLNVEPPQAPSVPPATAPAEISRAITPASPQPTTRATPIEAYQKIAEHLSVPMNLTRLSKETGLSGDILLPALRVMVEKGFVNSREMIEDIVYIPVTDLERKIDELPSLLSMPGGSASVTTPESEALVDCIRAAKRHLGEKISVADEALKQAESLTQQIRQLTEEIAFWKGLTEEVVRRWDEASETA